MEEVKVTRIFSASPKPPYKLIEYTVYGTRIPQKYGKYTYYTTHKKSLRTQQHPARAFTAAIKNSTRTGQAQASKTSQANTTQYYSTHSFVGTRMPALKLAPLHLANMPTDAR
jgi:hypothetical protein